MPSNNTTGLRDRKRAETRARIEAAAVDLATEVGLEAATVELISERADISPRTFFNYFETKDAAILGLQPTELDEETITEHLGTSDDEPVVAVVRLVMTMIGAVDRASSVLHRRRLKLLRKHPEILSSQFAHIDARKNRLVGYAAQVLARHPQFADDPDAEIRANLVLALCASAVRAAVDDWAQEATQKATNRKNTDEIDENAAVEARAVELVHTTLRRLA